jgi:hypothetical protein
MGKCSQCAIPRAAGWSTTVVSYSGDINCRLHSSDSVMISAVTYSSIAHQNPFLSATGFSRLSFSVPTPLLSTPPTQASTLNPEASVFWPEKSLVPALVPATPVCSAISLNPAQQANILGRMELLLCVAAAAFLERADSMDRLHPGIVAGIVFDWHCASRPPADGFLYDCQTQMELVVCNGRFVEDQFDEAVRKTPGRLHAALSAWEGIVGDLSPRVLCLSDAAIGQHLCALPELLTLLRAGRQTHTDLKELESEFQRLLSGIQRESEARARVMNSGVSR